MSVVVCKDQVYAATNNDEVPRVVNVYTYSGRWEKVHSFNTVNGMVTLSVKNNQIKCCSFREDNIAVRSLTGQLLATYGTNGGRAGQLIGPRMFDDDDDGSVLISDLLNDRLQVMSELGEFSVLQLQPQVSQPRSAILFDNQLYVISDKEKTVYKYSG